MMGRPISIVSSVSSTPYFSSRERGGEDTYDLVQALCSTQTGRACANDEDVNGTVEKNNCQLSDCQNNVAMS